MIPAAPEVTAVTAAAPEAAKAEAATVVVTEAVKAEAALAAGTAVVVQVVAALVVKAVAEKAAPTAVVFQVVAKEAAAVGRQRNTHLRLDGIARPEDADRIERRKHSRGVRCVAELLAHRGGQGRVLRGVLSNDAHLNLYRTATHNANGHPVGRDAERVGDGGYHVVNHCG